MKCRHKIYIVVNILFIIAFIPITNVSSPMIYEAGLTLFILLWFTIFVVEDIKERKGQNLKSKVLNYAVVLLITVSGIYSIYSGGDFSIAFIILAWILILVDKKKKRNT